MVSLILGGEGGGGGGMNLLTLPYLCLACLFEPIWELEEGGGGIGWFFVPMVLSSIFLVSVFVG